MNLDLALRIFLPVYITVYLLITYTLNVRGFTRRYGLDPRVTGRSDPVLFLCQRYRDGIFLTVLMVIGIYAALPSYYIHIVQIPYMDLPVIRIGGALILTASLGLVRLAQHQLGASWRIGIDRSGAETELVTNGLYRYSRNPIALGMFMNAVGLFLTLPNAVTLAIVPLARVILQIRIRIEEEHLRRKHGPAYEAYARVTRRWV
jgi:protein-S-isoprenylcysteine O-methyltransferase Ste14